MDVVAAIMMVVDVWSFGVLYGECAGGVCRKKEELGVHAATLCNNAEKLWTRSVNALHCSSHFEWIRSFFRTADVRSLQKEAS